MKRTLLSALVAILALASVAGALTYNRSSAKVMADDGVFWAADGSAAAPSVSFYSDTKTGLYLSAAGVVGVSVNGVATQSLSANGTLGPVPATQVIAAGNTITADACGGVKRISSAGAVATSTTNTFTAPAAANAGCVLNVCNVNAADAITLDDNANFSASAGADISLAGDECVQVGSDGVIWRTLSVKAVNHI